MLQRSVVPILLLFAVKLSGCVSNSYNEAVKPVSVPEVVRQKLNTARVVVGLDPNSSYNFIPQHNVGSSQQGGLLGALIESLIVQAHNDSIQEQQRLTVPIRSAAIKFNYGSKFRAALEKQLKTIRWLDIRSIYKAPNFQRSEAESLLATADEDVILVVDTFYKMAEDYSRLMVTAYVVMYPKRQILVTIARKRQQEKEPGEPAVLYQNKFSVDYPYEGEYKDATTSANGWAHEYGAMVHRALKSSIDKIVSRVVTDVQKPTRYVQTSQ